MNEGKNKITRADAKLQITEITRDFFLPDVSANTDVGNSKIQTVNVETFAIKIISTRESPVYL
jgi:hypothetical protein